MIKRGVCLRIIYVLVALLFACGKISAAVTTESKTVLSNNYVLILNCHLESVQWKYNYEDEITRYLRKTNQADVYTEHVKAINISSTEACDSVCDALFDKYKNRPRLVVLIGPAATAIFSDNLNNHWHNVPFLDCIHHEKTATFNDMIAAEHNEAMIKTVTDAEYQKRYNMTGIKTQTWTKENVKLLKDAFPEMNHLVFISDNRFGSFLSRLNFEKVMKDSYSDLTYDFISMPKYTTEQMLKKVSHYGNNTGIMFQAWAPEGDGPEDYYKWYNLYKIIGSHSQVPVFSQWDMNVSEGYISGGYFNSMKDLSSVAVGLVNQILNGTQPRDIPFKRVNNAHAYLNYESIKSYAVPGYQEPSYAIYYNYPENFLEKNKGYIITLAVLIVILILYLGQRIYYLNRQKEIQKKQIETEKDLRESLRLKNFKLALSLEVSTVCPWTWNIDKHTIAWDDSSKMLENPTAVNTFNETSIEECLASIHEEDREHMAAIFRGIRNGKANYMKEECRMTLPVDNGKYNWYFFQGVVYEKDEVGRPQTVLGTRTLITETKELEIELRHAKDKAEESSRLESAFLANISHELRTPLNAIVGFSGILANTEDADEKKEIVEIVQHNNRLLLNLVNDIIDISKLESGAIEFFYSDADINKIINDTVKENIKYLNSGVTIKANLPKKDCIYNIEKRRVAQILHCYVSNAIKFTQNGTIEVGYKFLDDGFIRVYVKDTGIGIPSDQLETIFGRFVKLNTFEQGSGLGLSVAQLLAQKLGGNVGVYSEYRIGSEFWADIPIELPDKQKNVNTKTQNRIKILVAEDITSNFIVLSSMLDQEYELIHARNGVEAVELFKLHHPALVLMDVKMPIMDGYAASAEIKKIVPDIPIIAISAYAFDDNKERMEASGFSDYEPKPVDPPSLKAKIDKIITKCKS